MDTATNASAKKILDLFGVPYHDAPGEAEAECAFLQQEGIVDAVLSEDVDTIMFGCTKTLRNWTAETKSGKTPTHVSAYNVNDEGFRKAGLDREGMVLVALLSGGDYIPEGIPGCGPKVACEAARAGFGRSLCRLKRADEAGLARWKESLIHELRTNESGFFKRRHMALTIPQEFPNLDVLRYYTHPVVSTAARIRQIKDDGFLPKPVNMRAMRQFVDEKFDWKYRIGADKLIRVIAPALLVQKLMGRSGRTAEDEPALVKNITMRRAHHSTDGIEELRVQYVPVEISGLDLSQEIEETISFARGGLALNSDDEFDDAEAQDDGKPTKKRFDPTAIDTIWLPEAVVRLGAPRKAEEWDERRRRKLEGQKKPTIGCRRGKGKTTGAPKETLDKWVKLAKPTSEDTKATSARRVEGEDSMVAKDQAMAKARESKQNHNTALPPDHNLWTIEGSQTAPRITKISITTAHDATSPIILLSSPPPRPGAPDASLPRSHESATALHATPRNNIPPDSSDPPDAPSWLKSSPLLPTTGKGQKEKRGPQLRPKQSTLDSFLSSPAPNKAVDTVPSGPCSKRRLERRPMKKNPKGAEDSSSLFPITKKQAGCESHPLGTASATVLSCKNARPKQKAYTWIIDSESDPADETSDIPSRERLGGSRGMSRVPTVIDLTSDD